MIRDNQGKNLRKISKELRRITAAWTEFLQWETVRNIRVRKYLSSCTVGSFISLLLAGIFWFTRGPALVETQTVFKQSSALTFAYPWLMGGGVVSVAVGFVRANYYSFKRMYDCFLAACGLFIFSPLFMLIGILVKMDSEGPVFFKQQRLGQYGKLFWMWKFRTMRHNAEFETGPVWTGENDPRITRLGKFLRTSHLDELPQLFNVVCGDMSLIGPRPERPEFTQTISNEVPGFMHRLGVRPGITGLAQVRYQYGASIKDAGRKLKYDLLYIRRMCWFLDFQILFWTLGRVLTGEGAR